MPNTSTPVTPGSGQAVDGYTGTYAGLRQSFVLGDPAGVQAASVSAEGAVVVDVNAVQRTTYKTLLMPAAAALAAGTVRYFCGLYHPASATKTIKLRTIEASVLMTGVAEATVMQVHHITTAPTSPTFVAPNTRSATGTHASIVRGEATPEALAFVAATTMPTSAGIIAHNFLSQGGATVHGGGAKIYDHQEGGPHQPLIAKAGALEGFMIGLLSNGAPTATLTVEFTFTEE